MTDINKIAEIVALISIFINGIFDLRDRETYTSIFLISAITSLIFGPSKILAVIAILVIVFGKDHKKIGGGDVDAIVVAGAGLYSSTYIVVLITIVLSILWRIFKGKEIPFVGLMGIGCFIAVLTGGNIF